VRLENLVGQDPAVTVLQRAIATSRVPHAYLFEGPAGVGKRCAAIGLAMALNCEASAQAPDKTACGACEACRRISGGLHPDVLTFTAEGTQILMEQAQEIVSLGQRPPHEARARVIIIDDADRLNANAANCLLKTLEEPSAGTHLVLVTSAPDRLLDTIRSRTQRVRFRAVPAEALLELGARRGIDPTHARGAAIVADGCVARFLDLATNAEDQGIREAAAALRQAARARGIAPILDTAAELGDKESKARLPEALALLARLYRDALVMVVGAPELAVFGSDDEAEALPRTPLTPPTGFTVPAGLAVPAGLTVPALGRALGAIVEAGESLTGNVNAVMAIERLLLNLRREERAPS
jgi:DNA polymerase-3 subunit delta'